MSMLQNLKITQPPLIGSLHKTIQESQYQKIDVSNTPPEESNWTLHLWDTSPTVQFTYCLVISPTGQFAY